MRVVAPLDHLADVGDAGGAQQLPQLGELLVLAVGQRRDHVGALAGPPSRALSGRPGATRCASVTAASVHNADGSSRHARADRRPSGQLAAHRRLEALAPPPAAGRRASSARCGRSPRRWGRRRRPGEITTAACSSTCSQYAAAESNPGGHRRPDVDRALRRRHVDAGLRKRVAHEVAAARDRPRSSPAPRRRPRAPAPPRRRAGRRRSCPSRCSTSAASTARSRRRCRRSPRSASRSCCSPWTARTPRRRPPWRPGVCRNDGAT